MDKFLQSNSKYSLEDNYHKACSDKDFSNYVKTLPISEDLLMKYTSQLQECVNMRKICRNCGGLKECPHSVKGYVLTPSQDNKRVIPVYCYKAR